jgi:hypothetical protein
MDISFDAPTTHNFVDGSKRVHVWVLVRGDERQGDNPRKARYVAAQAVRKYSTAPGRIYALSSGGQFFGNGEFHTSVLYSIPA